jgi:hypothetical protein
MNKLSNFSLEFFSRSSPAKSSLLCGFVAFALSAAAGLGINYFEDRHYWLVYTFIGGFALINGIFAGRLSAIFGDNSREIDRTKIEAATLKLKFDREIWQANERIESVKIEQFRSQAVALATQTELTATIRQLNIATQEIIAAQKNADIARSTAVEIDLKLAKTIQEKLKAEEDARLSQAKVDEITHRLAETIQEKLKAEEDARLAQAKVDETDRERVKTEEEARLAQVKATEIAHKLAAKIQEKLKAEEEARLAQAKATEIAHKLAAKIQEKLKAEEEARLAQARVTEIADRLVATTQEKLEAEKNVEDLYQSIDTEFTTYEKLRQENTDLKLTICELERLETDENTIDENTSIQCLTVHDALKTARQKFRILNIWNHALTTAIKIDHYLPKRVYTVLEILAEVGDIYFQGTTSNSIPELLRKRGVPCSRESMTTMGKYGYERDFPCQGKKTQRMELHLKIGRKIRIYFDVDTESQQILIGYCGHHLQTATG